MTPGGWRAPTWRVSQHQPKIRHNSRNMHRLQYLPPPPVSPMHPHLNHPRHPRHPQRATRTSPTWNGNHLDLVTIHRWIAIKVLPLYGSHSTHRNAFLRLRPMTIKWLSETSVPQVQRPKQEEHWHTIGPVLKLIDSKGWLPIRQKRLNAERYCHGATK